MPMIYPGTTTQPTNLSATGSPNQSVGNGTSVTFTATASGGTPGYTYKWYESGAPATVLGTGSSYTFTAQTGDDGKSYYCTVTDSSTPTPQTANTPPATLTVTTAPALTTTAPTNKSVAEGTSVTFTTTPSGGTPGYTYRWYEAGAPTSILGTNQSYTFTTAFGDNGKSYYCTVTDSGTPTPQTVNSGNATLTVSCSVPTLVTPLPAVSDRPEGSTFTLSAVGGGASTWVGQWNNGGTWQNLNNGTGNNASWTSSGLADSGYQDLEYRFTFTNSCGSVTTTTKMNITTTAPALATTAPTSKTVSEGASVTFTTTPSGGTPGYTYKWYNAAQPATVLSTSQSYTFTTTINDNGKSYYCIVTDSTTPTAQTVNSGSANLTVTTTSGPLTATNDGDQTATAGTSVTFTATGSGGTPGYTYKWYQQGVPSVVESTNAAFTFTAQTGDNGKRFYCEITDSSSPTPQTATTPLATLTVTANTPLTTTAPANKTVFEDESVTFTTTPSGGIPGYTYKWYKTGSPATVLSTSQSYTFTTVLGDNGNSYYCTVTDSSSPTPLTVNSAAANLTVTSKGPAPTTTSPVEIKYTGQAISAQDKQCIEDGLAVINNIMTADLPPQSYGGNPSYTGIEIDVSINPALSGSGSYATGRPDQLRNTSLLALTGIVEINPDLLPSVDPLGSCEAFAEVLVHEFLHCISMHDLFINFQSLGTYGDCGPDATVDTADDVSNGKYTGPIALAEYRTAIGNPTAPYIPMQCLLAHWIENDKFGDQGLGDELMTTTANVPNKLSRVTIAVLEDIGYPGINYYEAQTWP